MDKQLTLTKGDSREESGKRGENPVISSPVAICEQVQFATKKGVCVCVCDSLNNIPNQNTTDFNGREPCEFLLTSYYAHHS